MVNDIDQPSLASLSWMEIREATAGEHDEIGRVTAEAYRGLVRDETYLARIADVADRAHRTEILVAVEQGSILGSLTLELTTRVNVDDDPLEAHRAHIRMLGVAPDAQGRGVGTALMRGGQRRDNAAGKREMTLHTTKRMAAAQALYAGLGYDRTSEEVFPDGFVLLGYRKVLDAASD
jgi:ribosomal protein S18 acetylase RimI-like enzyme